MDYAVHSIIPKHQKGKHLFLEERVFIQTRIKDGCSFRVLHMSSAALLLLSAMSLKEVLFCFITARRNAIKPNTAMRSIKLTVRTVAASQTF